MQFRYFLLAATITAAAYGQSMNILKQSFDCVLDVIDVNGCTGKAKIGTLPMGGDVYGGCNFNMILNNATTRYAPICDSAKVTMVGLGSNQANNQITIENKEGQKVKCNPEDPTTPPHACKIVW